MSTARPGQRTAQTAYRAGLQSSAALGRAARRSGGMSSRMTLKLQDGWAEVCEDPERGCETLRRVGDSEGEES